jgi:hypothetical protein
LIITANQINGSDQFVIEIESNRVSTLLDVFSGDFHHLANHLKILDNRMVLVNPKYKPEPEVSDSHAYKEKSEKKSYPD